MKNLVVTDNHGHFYTTTKKIADMLSNKSYTHRNVIKTLEEQILNKYDSIGEVDNFRVRDHALENEAVNVFESNISGALFVDSQFKSRGKSQRAYYLNEEAYQLLITHLTGYKKARELNEYFILAFKQLRQHYQNTKTLSKLDEQEILENIVPFDKHGTISKVNGEPREKIVKSYYRSKNAKAIDENLVERIEVTQLTLFGDAETYVQKLQGRI